mmetsp:Transcript_1806/g.3968  ORF Transcript_1806/g.3968 Transcript_1806/m.3968 type:complete len:215 (-) Transcript_1806:135-779(-)
MPFSQMTKQTPPQVVLHPPRGSPSSISLCLLRSPSGPPQAQTQYQTHHKPHRHQHSSRVLPVHHNVLKVICRHLEVLVLLCQLPEFLRLLFEPRRRTRDRQILGFGVSPPDVLDQGVQFAAALVSVHFPISEVKEGREAPNIETLSEGCVLCDIDLGDDDAVLRVVRGGAIGEVVPDGLKALAVAAPGSVELHEPLPRRLSGGSLSLVLKTVIG